MNIIWKEEENKMIKRYTDYMNSNQTSISNLKKEFSKQGENVIIPLKMQDFITKKINEIRENKTIFYLELIKKIMNENNGIIKTSMLEPLNISRNYIQMLEKSGEIEKIDRGIYIIKNVMQDDFYIFQQKHKKIIYSHMTALYFYGMTEEIPYNYSVTVPVGYHNADVNSSCYVFYANEKNYNLGISNVKTPNGNIIRAYDLERCICDIIKSKNRMDFEQVKKSVIAYVKNKNKDLVKLSKYAKQMNISKEVMEMVGMYYE